MGDANIVGAAEACEILGVSRATLLRWAAPDGRLPGQKMPGETGAYLFHRAAVMRLKDELDDEREAAAVNG